MSLTTPYPAEHRTLSRSTLDRIVAGGARRVSGESLAFLRIAFGAIGLLSALRLFANGWVSSLLTDPANHLRYPGLGWVPVPPGWIVHVLVAAVALASLGVLLGLFHRWSVAVFLVSFTWVELIEATLYLNHYWFMTLVGATLLVVPASARWSLDSRRRGQSDVPAAAVWVLRFQVGAVYAFAGLAKLHGDWLDGLPLSLWLPSRADLWLLGDVLEWRSTAVVASWAGAVFDCTVVGFLLWRRTRLAAWCVLVVFHLATWILFPVIGVFPFLMIPMATIMFEPDWPSRLAGRFAQQSCRPEQAAASVPTPSSAQSPARTRLLAGVALLWVALQLALPLRHHLYPGDHRWTGEGLRFGWNVMLVEKAGDVTFVVTDPRTGETWHDEATSLYTPAQLRVMRTDPEMIRQAATEVARANGATPEAPLEVRARAVVSLNGRPPAVLVDPEVDLAAVASGPMHRAWIMPAPTTRAPG